MNSLTSAELASMRAEINSILDQDCTILTRTTTTGAAGGVKSAWTSTITKCRLNPLSPKEYEFSDKLNGSMGWIITLPYDTEISNQDRIAIETKTYEIIGISNTPSIQLLIRAIAVEIN